MSGAGCLKKRRRSLGLVLAGRLCRIQKRRGKEDKRGLAEQADGQIATSGGRVGYLWLFVFLGLSSCLFFCPGKPFSQAGNTREPPRLFTGVTINRLSVSFGALYFPRLSLSRSLPSRRPSKRKSRVVGDDREKDSNRETQIRLTLSEKQKTQTLSD